MKYEIRTPMDPARVIEADHATVTPAGELEFRVEAGCDYSLVAAFAAGQWFEFQALAEWTGILEGAARQHVQAAEEGHTSDLREP